MKEETGVKKYMKDLMLEYLLQQLTCPQCDIPSMIEDPHDPEQLWCALCGCTKPLVEDDDQEKVYEFIQDDKVVLRLQKNLIEENRPPWIKPGFMEEELKKEKQRQQRRY